MKPLFTVHAGEYLVATEIERRFRKLPTLDVWVPSMDRGIDLLVTNPATQKMVSLQVKFSKDFTQNQKWGTLERSFKSTGFWKHSRDKLRESPADRCVFVLPSFEYKDNSFVLIPPKELLRRLSIIHTEHTATIYSYFWITRGNKGKCWETRGASKDEKQAMINGEYPLEKRDFSSFLNNWDLMTEKLK